ncbi:MAG: GTP-binding protein [Bacteroidales bacterium]|jgi:sulfate adenylyltransferase subunit 1|nr:GTP-binding protein [Bacteroidales bacterium]
MDKGYLDMELLRFTTAGSVDDGKSTLIGRLLYDSKSIFEDQMEAVETASKRSGNEEVNLALLTDGLRSEREQGITIDVAYRYFATPKRKFIIADTPGHIQYTRNMVTGASTADLAIILIDARNGVLEQTLRHSFIASLLGIPNIVVCINKMDLAGFSEKIYENIKRQYHDMIGKLQLTNVYFIPISAKLGDNVVTASENMPWYTGSTLMEQLETTPIDHKLNTLEMRFPVQYVIRPISDRFHDFRGYAGRMAGGVLKKGDTVVALPSKRRSTVSAITRCDKELDEAFTPDSITIQLADDIDVSRGDILAGEGEQPSVSQDVTLMICWFNERPLHAGSKYLIMHMTRETVGVVKRINNTVNINTLELGAATDVLNMNDIASITIKTAQPLVFDAYKKNRTTGSLVFVDPDTFETVGAGMITQ